VSVLRLCPVQKCYARKLAREHALADAVDNARSVSVALKIRLVVAGVVVEIVVVGVVVGVMVVVMGVVASKTVVLVIRSSSLSAAAQLGPAKSLRLPSWWVVVVLDVVLSTM
jgi:hypothetical protein